MSQYWLVSWTPENYDIYKSMEYSTFGIPEGHQNIAKSIAPGDRLIIYTLREQRIRAICECVSGYFYNEEIIWPDGTYPHRLRTKLLFEGDLDYSSIRNQLGVSKHGSLQKGLELRGGYKRLSPEDYHLIESRFSTDSTLAPPIKGNRPPVKDERPTLSHSDIVKALESVGKLLGKKVELEWRGHEYRHDVAWKDKEYFPPSTVIEVCDKGVLEKDILALEWAIRNLEATAILVTVSDSDFIQAKRRIPAASGIVVVKASAVIKLQELLEGDPELMKAVFKPKK